MVTLFLKMIMKEKQISEHIWKLEFNFYFLIISIWLVKNNNNVFLIDTGISKIWKIACNSASGKGNIRGVILTHGHSDHAGGVNQINAHNPELPIFMNGRDYEYSSGENPFPGRKKIEKIISTEVPIIDLRKINQNDFFELTGLKIMYTPGHSPGHTVFYHDNDKVLIAGDLYTEKNGLLRPPMKQFTSDMPQALLSGRQLFEKIDPKIISVCHGKDVNAPFDFSKVV
ncbi:MBL fold metallo-hydrolase [Lacticaseibacillus paracasei]|uniref:Metallo-beta-lactamase domain-containing protein n=1 Tax=Lacticaseibacillus paracasei subsp. paracasei Lpp49 TaxID=1256213 RepID=A0ABC9TB45_LACPA|nr:MBL fold metallo-hydrolase [Lacticaseibacillus paracasei]EPC90440.1 hypothetical protein Lpp49_09877 [Lacticaseibacillus paracasei subsp. paracasei Lpp49]